MAETENLGLYVTESADNPNFIDWRNKINGNTADSNMVILDRVIQDLKDQIAALGNGGSSGGTLDPSIQNQINQLQQSIAVLENTVGIDHLERTNGDGSPGTTDTYTFIFKDGRRFSFEVYNGANGTGGEGGSGTLDPEVIKQAVVNFLESNENKYIGEVTIDANNYINNEGNIVVEAKDDNRDLIAYKKVIIVPPHVTMGDDLSLLGNYTIVPTVNQQVIRAEDVSEFDGFEQVTVEGFPLDETSVNMEGQSLELNAPNGRGYKKVTVNYTGPTGQDVVLRDNITVTPSQERVVKKASAENADGYRQVSVEAAPLEMGKVVEMRTPTQTVTPANGYYGIGSMEVKYLPALDTDLSCKGIRFATDETIVSYNEAEYHIFFYYTPANTVDVPQVSWAKYSDQTVVTPTYFTQKVNQVNADNGLAEIVLCVTGNLLDGFPNRIMHDSITVSCGQYSATHNITILPKDTDINGPMDMVVVQSTNELNSVDDEVVLSYAAAGIPVDQIIVCSYDGNAANYLELVSGTGDIFSGEYKFTVTSLPEYDTQCRITIGNELISKQAFVLIKGSIGVEPPEEEESEESHIIKETQVFTGFYYYKDGGDELVYGDLGSAIHGELDWDHTGDIYVPLDIKPNRKLLGAISITSTLNDWWKEVMYSQSSEYTRRVVNLNLNISKENRWRDSQGYYRNTGSVSYDKSNMTGDGELTQENLAQINLENINDKLYAHIYIKNGGDRPDAEGSISGSVRPHNHNAYEFGYGRTYQITLEYFVDTSDGGDGYIHKFEWLLDSQMYPYTASRVPKNIGLGDGLTKIVVKSAYDTNSRYDDINKMVVTVPEKFPIPVPEHTDITGSNVDMVRHDDTTRYGYLRNTYDFNDYYETSMSSSGGSWNIEPERNGYYIDYYYASSVRFWKDKDHINTFRAGLTDEEILNPESGFTNYVYIDLYPDYLLDDVAFTFSDPNARVVGQIEAVPSYPDAYKVYIATEEAGTLDITMSFVGVEAAATMTVNVLPALVREVTKMELPQSTGFLTFPDQTSKLINVMMYPAETLGEIDNITISDSLKSYIEIGDISYSTGAGYKLAAVNFNSTMTAPPPQDTVGTITFTSGEVSAIYTLTVPYVRVNCERITTDTGNVTISGVPYSLYSEREIRFDIYPASYNGEITLNNFTIKDSETSTTPVYLISPTIQVEKKSDRIRVILKTQRASGYINQSYRATVTLTLDGSQGSISEYANIYVEPKVDDTLRDIYFNESANGVYAINGNTMDVLVFVRPDIVPEDEWSDVRVDDYVEIEPYFANSDLMVTTNSSSQYYSSYTSEWGERMLKAVSRPNSNTDIFAQYQYYSPSIGKTLIVRYHICKVLPAVVNTNIPVNTNGVSFEPTIFPSLNHTTEYEEWDYAWTINANGVMKPTGAYTGDTTFTVNIYAETINGNEQIVNYAYNINIYDDSIHCNSVSLGEGEVEFARGTARDVSINKSPAYTTDAVSVESGDTNIVKASIVNNKLRLAGQARGSTTVTVRCGNAYATIDVYVYDYINTSIHYSTKDGSGKYQLVLANNDSYVIAMSSAAPQTIRAAQIQGISRNAVPDGKADGSAWLDIGEAIIGGSTTGGIPTLYLNATGYPIASIETNLSQLERMSCSASIVPDGDGVEVAFNANNANIKKYLFGDYTISIRIAY